ncbi:hypothetical protein CALVIDRAFT_532276 [Calocera viscosa TUFC12733]|uniref:Pericentrin/AKAP-450 centrosomal targeting domain-containing protein n=1 Tax=Calocera viscosa (strain TUFC12733) TaxID=1330018 RepID=A0A167S2A0_CALVF|nr:hypothetical protein CALVIDRAFT_532276 [Calocera viscosa TUFC12733]
MKRAFSSSPAAVAEESDQTKSASISKLPPLPASSPMNSHFTTIASVPQTPMAAGPNSGTSRRASYVLSVLSSTKPRVKATPHPYRAPIRRTPHPLIRVPLERRASFATVTTSTPSTNNDLTTNLKANTSFDPAIGETRFNVAKMNGYLHKLNEKLVEENLGLHLALKEYEGSSSSHSIAPALELAQAEEWQHVVASLREELDAANAKRERLADEVRRLTANAGRKEMEWDAKLREELDAANATQLSWMQNSTLSVAQIAPLLSEIQRLRDEVAVKEQKVDDELDGLQDAFGRNNNVLRRLQEEIDRREKLQVEVNEFTRREHMERAEREALTERHRVELDNMAEELQAASQEKQRLHEDRIEVQRMIRDLERDLQRLRREADRFGHDLSDLQAEKARVEAKRSEEKALSERQRQRSATEVRLVKEQLSAAQTEARTEIEQLRIQHKKECKGLIVQIHYLKDLYRRETVFRMDLAYQKSYLQAALARQPYLLPQAPRIERPISLRGAAQAVIFISRIKHSSDQWRSQRAHRPSMYAALEDARRRRTSS